MRHGSDVGYKTWVHHDEPDLPLPPLLIDNTRQPQMSDMTALLNNLSYIPPNNEHNETSNKPTQATRIEFEELYASANEELYPGCDYVTRLDFMAKFTYFKVKDLDFRPVYNTSRWKYSNTLGKKVPKKVLRYFSIIPRLQRLYKSSHTAKEMIWQATRKCTEPGKMQHPVDGKAWKNFDTKYPDFTKEPRNVRLGLAADGFNPFGNLSQAYNIWPMILTTYNLPSRLCMKESSFMLTLLIHGPKSSGKDIDVYLRPLIEDLKVLWDRKGVETIDVASGQKFNMRAMVLWIINDFPARSSLSGWSWQGYKACPTLINDLKKCGYSKDNLELNFKFLNNLQPEWKQYAIMMRQNKNLKDINIDALYNILKQNQGDVNDAMGFKKKLIMVTSDPFALIAEKTKVSKSKEKVVVSSDSEGSSSDDFTKVKDYEYYKTKMLLAKKDKDE
nr:hypothetical protein [Tanacetum cinerariifolium]